MGVPLPVEEPLGGPVAQALQQVADAIDGDVDALASELTELLHSELPELGSDPAAHDETRRSTLVHLVAITDAVRHGRRPQDMEPVPEALAFARATVRRGVALGLILRGYSLAHGFFLQAWQERLFAAGLEQTVSADASRRLTATTFAFFDGLTRQLTLEYERERERWLRGAHALRAETVRAIVAGSPVDPDSASRTLAYELRRHHVGLILWAAPEADEMTALALLERTAVEIAALISSRRPLVLAAGAARVWAWAASDSPPDLSALDAGGPRGDGVSIGLGEPGHGLDGFRRTHRDADDAARVAMLAERAPGLVTRYRSVQVGALLAGDLVRSARFVRDQLGPLCADSDEYARLRETLAAFLDEHGSRVAAARRLNVHSNTVAHRVKACAGLLGRDPRENSLELQLALSLAATLGRAVLDG